VIAALELRSGADFLRKRYVRRSAPDSFRWNESGRHTIAVPES